MHKLLSGLLLVTLIISGFAVRYGQFRGCSLHRDEPGTNTLALRSVMEYAYPEHGAEKTEINGAFYYKFIQYPWQIFSSCILGDDTVSGYRFSSVIGALAGFAVIFVLGRRCAGTWTALLALAFLSINGCHQYYSNYMRYHIFSLFLAAAASLQFIHTLKKPSSGRWSTYHILTVLNIYTSLNNITLFPAHWVCAALYAKFSRSLPEKERKILLCNIIASAVLCILSFIPMPLWDTGALSRMDWYPVLSAPLMLNIFCCLAGLKEYLCDPASILYLSGAFIFIVLGSVSAFEELRQGRIEKIMLFAWLIIPILLHIAVSVIIHPIIIARNLIFLMPPFFLLMALGMRRLAASKAGAALVLVFAVFSAPAMLAQCGHNVYYDWDEVILPQYYSTHLDGCCRYPGDHIKHHYKIP